MQTVVVSLPDDQLSLLLSIKKQNEQILRGISAKDVWLNDDTIAQHFGVSKSLITKWRKDFALPFSQIGEVRRYNVAEVDRWFAKYSPKNVLR